MTIDPIMLPIRVPTIGIETLCAVTGETESVARDMVEATDALPWSWDVSVRHDGRALRVLTLCVEDLLLFPNPNDRPTRTLKEVTRHMAGHWRGDVPSAVVATILQTSQPHVEKLIEAGALAVCGADRRFVTRVSLQQFLAERKLL